MTRTQTRTPRTLIRTQAIAAGGLALALACANESPTDNGDDSGIGPGVGTSVGSADDTHGPGHTTTDGASEGDVKVDVGSPETGGSGCPEGGCEQCTAVDLLFVIDNSLSMQPYQIALGQAFPTFADAIIDALPPGTNLHVGITSTEMGYAAFGHTWISGTLDNPECLACGKDTAPNCDAAAGSGRPIEDYYITPDAMNSGKNGTQGRLYQADGLPYFSLSTDAPASEVQALKEWFAAASNIGEGGSNVEMSTAAAAWATSPVNDPTNTGFLRDDKAVLVLFFVQDEFDQTPMGEASTLVDMIDSAKPQCGGLDCVVAGGFVNTLCLPGTSPVVPLGVLFEALGGPAVAEMLPEPEVVTPQTFESTLRDTLTQVIAQKCDEIVPEG